MREDDFDARRFQVVDSSVAGEIAPGFGQTEPAAMWSDNGRIRAMTAGAFFQVERRDDMPAKH